MCLTTEAGGKTGTSGKMMRNLKGENNAQELVTLYTMFNTCTVSDILETTTRQEEEHGCAI